MQAIRILFVFPTRLARNGMVILRPFNALSDRGYFVPNHLSPPVAKFFQALPGNSLVTKCLASSNPSRRFLFLNPLRLEAVDSRLQARVP